ncbi:GNAT family N-acetyltransferase [Chitinimonas naiadis]
MIRPAEQKDCLNLAALSLQVWLHTYAMEGMRDEISRYALTTFTPDYFAQRIASPRYRLYVKTSGYHLLGFISVDLAASCPVDANAGLEVETLYVHVHFKGQSIGSQLLRTALAELGPKLWLTTWVHNTQAIGFYRAFGFTDIGATWFEMEGEQHENRVLAYAAK